MEGTGAGRYWCYQCLRTVNPIMEVEAIKCPVCQNGFVEQMESAAETTENPSGLGGNGSVGSLSLWSPILLAMVGSPRGSNNTDNNGGFRAETLIESRSPEGDDDRRRRNAAALLRLLEGVRAETLAESTNADGNEDRDNENNGGDLRAATLLRLLQGGARAESTNEDRENRVMLINPFNQTIIIGDSHTNHTATFSDYSIGPGLDMMLQHLVENGQNRYGTPPARKEAVEALPEVKVGEDEDVQCCVCLEDFEVGAEAKEMPCKHRFHGGCILPWLNLHSSCPVCRHQLPSEPESNRPQDSSRNQNPESNNTSDSNRSDERNENGGWFSASFLWPFASLFSSSSS